MQTKATLIDGILHLNPTARAEWLDHFDPPALERYLDHLQHAIEPRGRTSFWIRDAESTAVVTRRRSAA